MNLLASGRLSAAAVVAISTLLLLSASGQAASAVSIGAPPTNDLDAGIMSKGWIQFSTGETNLDDQVSGSAVVAPDFYFNVTDSPQMHGGTASAVSYTYSDAASVLNSGLTASEGNVQAGDLNLTIHAPRTNAYVLRVYGRDRWGPVDIEVSSLSDEHTATAQGGGALTELYGFDIAYLSATVSALPEPVPLGAISLSAVGLLRRRRTALMPAN